MSYENTVSTKLTLDDLQSYADKILSDDYKNDYKHFLLTPPSADNDMLEAPEDVKNDAVRLFYYLTEKGHVCFLE